MRFAIYISGKGGRLRNLFENDSFVLKDITLIISDSNESTYLKEYALKHAIEFISFDTYKQKGIGLAFSNFMLGLFLEKKIDYCYCFGNRILRGNLLNKYRKKIINFHPSILPMFPGLMAIDQALESDNTILLGNTAHFIDEGVDTGPIIVQTIIPKSNFQILGYDGLLNLQIGMLEFIHKSLLENAIFFKDNMVYFSDSSTNTKLFYNK